MSVTSLMRFSATITLVDPDTTTGTDPYGNPIYATSEIVTKCYFEQQSSDEDC